MEAGIVFGLIGGAIVGTIYVLARLALTRMFAFITRTEIHDVWDD